MDFVRLVVRRKLDLEEKKEFRDIIEDFDYVVTYVTKEDGAYKYIVDKHVSDEDMLEIIKEWDEFYDDRYFIENSVEPSHFTDEEKIEIANELTRELHADFVKKKTDEGWRYGEEFSTKEKTSPMLVPFDQLPDNFKDYTPLYFSKMLNIVSKKMSD